MIVETFNPSPNHKWTGPQTNLHASSQQDLDGCLAKAGSTSMSETGSDLPLGKWGPTNHQSDHPSSLGQGQTTCRKSPKAFPPALHL